MTDEQSRMAALRTAFVAGMLWPQQTSDSEQAWAIAKSLFPCAEPSTRLRIVVDPHYDRARWRLIGERFEVAMNGEDWEPADGFLLTRERVRLLADLLANPEEAV